MDTKTADELRRQMHQIRNCMSIGECERYSGIICEKLYEYIDEHPGIGSILCFYPKGNEVSLLPLYEKLFGMYRLYFPVTYNEDISFYRAEDLSNETFSCGKFGIMEPREKNVGFPVDKTEEKRTIAIVPGLVFDDERMGRIGYGKGYYDRFLNRYESIYKIGVCFGFQIKKNIPQTDTDVAMDMIMTNTDTYEYK